jgi:hypothetical protein
VTDRNKSPDCNACGWREELRGIRKEVEGVRGDVRGLRRELKQGLQLTTRDDGQLELKIGPAQVKGQWRAVALVACALAVVVSTAWVARWWGPPSHSVAPQAQK